MWGRKADTYQFPSLNLEVSVSELSGSRNLDMNGGVAVEIKKDQTIRSLGIRCDASYRGGIQKLDPTYHQIFKRQGEYINTLNELLEMIQDQGTAEEKALLPALLKSIEAACLKALSWLRDEQVTINNLNAYQFIGAGKRMDVETYDLATLIPSPVASLTLQ